MVVKLERMKEMAEELRKFPATVAGIDREKPIAVWAEAQAQYFEAIIKAAEEGKPIAYNQFCLWPELLYAFDIQSLGPEAMVETPLALDPQFCVPYIDAARGKGIHDELCGTNRGPIGQLILGDIPPPTFILTHSQPCDSSRIAYQIMQRISGAPLFCLDAPYWETEDAVTYYETQLRQMISFIEDQVGRRLDWDRFRHVVEESNRMMEYWVEWLELKKMVPCPSDSKTGALALNVASTLGGHPLGTAVMKTMRDDAKERAQKGQGVVPEEKIRANWFYIHVYFDIMWHDYLQEHYGAVSVIDMLCYTVSEPIDTSSPERLIRGLAKRYLASIPMGRQGRGSVDTYLDDLLYTAKEWKADCIILAGANGCKWLKASYGIVRRECRRAGIPIMMFDVDIYDPRVVSKETYRKQVEDFLTIVVLPAKAEQSKR